MEKRIKLYSIMVLLAISFWSSNDIWGQDKTDPGKLTEKNRNAIIKKISEVYLEYYPLPEVSKKMIRFIQKENKKGKYDGCPDILNLTSQLTRDLRFISNDYHIRIYPYEKIPDELKAETRLGSGEDNYGFQKVEHMLGNMGYINLTSFYNTRSAGQTAIAAMNFVAHSDALIIDLRSNGGGDKSMAQFISSYFFDSSTHLYNDIIRKDNKTNQIWTQEWVPGPKILHAPIYILLSSYSYSSSEVLAYHLQQLGRAVIVGEKTRGGAHAVTYRSYKDLSVNFKIPYTQDMNPYSKTNYIKGVIPDIAVSADKALTAARIAAAKKLLETIKDKNKRYKLIWIISGLQVELNPPVLNDTSFSEFVGIYQNVKVISKCGSLYIEDKSKKMEELIPMGKDIFKYKNPEEKKYRIQFLRGKTGEVVEFRWFDSDGDNHPPKKRL